MIDKQRVFNRVARHLRDQGRIADAESNDSGCMYKTPDGLKCGIGCLIPKDCYDEQFENQNIGQLIELAVLSVPEPRKRMARHLSKLREFLGDLGVELNPRLTTTRRDDMQFLGELQSVHDDHDLDMWRESMLQLAKKWRLVVEADIATEWPCERRAA